MQQAQELLSVHDGSRTTHRLIALWTQLGVDGPRSQDEGGPARHPRGPLGLGGFALSLPGAEIAQRVREITGVM